VLGGEYAPPLCVALPLAPEGGADTVEISKLVTPMPCPTKIAFVILPFGITGQLYFEPFEAVTHT
jgi:hypothetical protein